MSSTSGNGPKEPDPRVWMSLVTTVIAVLAWFGISNYHQLQTWLADSSPSATPTPPPAATLYTDPGCTAFQQALHSFNASQNDAPATYSPAQITAVVIEYRDAANAFDSAAASAHLPQVATAISAAAADYRTFADDMEAGDVNAMRSSSTQMTNDLDAVSTACLLDHIS